MPELGALWTDPVRGKGMPHLPTAGIALPQDIRGRMEVTFGTGDSHFIGSSECWDHMLISIQIIPCAAIDRGETLSFYLRLLGIAAAISTRSTNPGPRIA